MLVSSMGESSQVGQQMLITPLGSPSLWPVCLLGTCVYIPCRLSSNQVSVSLKTTDLIQGFFHTVWRHSAGQLSEHSPVILCISQECGSQRVWVSHHLSRGLLKNSITLLQLTAEKREFFWLLSSFCYSCLQLVSPFPLFSDPLNVLS